MVYIKMTVVNKYTQSLGILLLTKRSARVAYNVKGRDKVKPLLQ